MIRTKIWVVFALVSLSAALAQQESRGRITLHVSDQTGAVVPGAQVVIKMAHGTPSLPAVTDMHGTAILDLSPGTYEVSVMSLGFKTWRSQFNVADLQDLVTAVELKVGQNSGPVAAVMGEPRLQPDPPPLILLPSGNMASLPSLPARTPKKRQ